MATMPSVRPWAAVEADAAALPSGFAHHRDRQGRWRSPWRWPKRCPIGEGLLDKLATPVRRSLEWLAHQPMPRFNPHKTAPRVLMATLVALVGAAGPASAAEAPDWEALASRHLTLGAWLGAPLGPSGRAGLAWPLTEKNDSAVVGGVELGRQGTKQFLGWRTTLDGNGLIRAGVDVARWAMDADTSLGRKSREYLGLEAQLFILRLGIMWPREGGGGPRLTAAVGASY
jgi:hypothetical protein